MERCYYLLQRVVSAFELRLFKHIVSNKLKNWSPKQYMMMMMMTIMKMMTIVMMMTTVMMLMAIVMK